MHTADLATSQVRLTPDIRREQLIEATIKAIAEHGLSRVTLGKLGAEVGLSAGMINFHFENKQALLTATLKALADQYSTACEAAVAGHEDDPVAALLGLIEASFDTRICTPERVAVWYAFWSESRARAEYMAICGRSDAAFYEEVHQLIEQVAQKANSTIDVRAASLGLTGIVDALWQDVVIERETFDYSDAIATCQAYLKNLFPNLENLPGTVVDADENADDLPRTLPAWAYCSDTFFQRELERIHLPAWQVVCHQNDIPEPGDYKTFEAFGERAFVLRGGDGTLRAFNNVCPHRAHQVLQGDTGNCPGLIRCPYHAWGFDHAGELKAIAAQKTFPPFDNGKFGLKPLEIEVYAGFIFIRFRPGGPSLVDRFGPYENELAPYRFADMVPAGPIHEEEIAADWKNIWDNYLEDYHFPTGHPDLFALMSMDYVREPDDVTRTVKLHHHMRDKAKGGWSCERYARILPTHEHLPAEQRRSWRYYFAYPSFAFDVYPEVMDFFQIIPLTPGRSRLRFGSYGLASPSRAAIACRYLSGRINMRVHREDCALVTSVQKGLESSAYDRGLLGTKEIAVAALHRWVCADLPEADKQHPPTQ